ncbi:FadR/GntR family transcriptional regulator [Methylobacterium sp. SyP6R]|uniref:FadR/GntR family transcriptional regulator n=1 Tax=Methylobacterium sp. SyP6R TaxID=2718876 RepID=UPI001F3C1920|nr:FadR/GntR family transcriptional regulator [Methylobacterium sp. SyP6R]MCF4128213.1 FadR family transcriptional regulator [Methylobacterium sp. SyP6R]
MDETGARIVSSQGPGHARVARALGTGIVAGQFPEGAVLPAEPVLLARFGVSRTVLREAIKTLSGKGLLETRTRVGTRVRERAAWNLFDRDVLAWTLDAGIDRRFLRDLAEIRLAIEPAAAALAAERRTDGDVEALEACVAAMRAAPGLDPAFASADLAFHLALADASGNLFMHSVGAVTEAALDVVFRMSRPTDPHAHETSWRAHAAIAAAIRAGNPAAAARATKVVVRDGLRNGAAAVETAGPAPYPSAGPMPPAKSREESGPVRNRS